MHINKIFSTIAKENIHLIHKKIDKDLLGSYISIDSIHIIIINKNIQKDKRLYFTVLSEEIGHYYLSKGDHAPYQHNTYLDNLNYEKNENIALRWAVDFLVPTNDLLRFISTNGEIHLSDLSNHFQVTTDFIMKKIYYMSLLKNQYQLSSNRYFVVSNFPNTFIYQDFNERSFNHGHSTEAR